ncbi:hypothetical protein O181_000526 [Austropuccinia psidii MF-1]|uniref:Polysaccharide lyase 14 domain-containing protein n=1 Tax=Austropuccinia psidii MF-1 TaxID=1389203 RepID=A0A9Q3GBN5_9BASI|nr:hypothetical protein [Austropuccinia psidii MF-1]
MLLSLSDTTIALYLLRLSLADAPYVALRTLHQKNEQWLFATVQHTRIPWKVLIPIQVVPIPWQGDESSSRISASQTNREPINVQESDIINIAQTNFPSPSENAAALVRWDASDTSWTLPQNFSLTDLAVQQWMWGRKDNVQVISRETPVSEFYTKELKTQAEAGPLAQASGNVLQVRYPKGSINPGNKKAPQGGIGFYAQPINLAQAKSVTFSYSVFFPKDFDFVKGGKLPGLYGGKQGCSGGENSNNCFSTRIMFRTDGMGELYLYAPKNKQGPGVCKTPPMSYCNAEYGFSLGRGAWTFQRGAWTNVRQDIWLNTDGKKNGRFAIWINGNLTMSGNDVYYRNNVPGVETNSQSDPEAKGQNHTPKKKGSAAAASKLPAGGSKKPLKSKGPIKTQKNGNKDAKVSGSDNTISSKGDMAIHANDKPSKVAGHRAPSSSKKTPTGKQKGDEGSNTSAKNTSKVTSKQNGPVVSVATNEGNTKAKSSKSASAQKSSSMGKAQPQIPGEQVGSTARPGAADGRSSIGLTISGSILGQVTHLLGGLLGRAESRSVPLPERQRLHHQHRRSTKGTHFKNLLFLRAALNGSDSKSNASGAASVGDRYFGPFIPLGFENGTRPMPKVSSSSQPDTSSSISQDTAEDSPESTSNLTPPSKPTGTLSPKTPDIAFGILGEVLDLSAKPESKRNTAGQFIGIMGDTFFGGHDSSWESPKEQYTYFKAFQLTINS